MRFCTECGKPLGDNLLFCTACGSPVPTHPAAELEPPPHAPAQGAEPAGSAPTAPRTSRSRRSAVLVLVLLLIGTAAVGVTLTQQGASRQAVAATIGSERITSAALNRSVNLGLADPAAQKAVGSDRAAFERTVLRRLIDHVILAKLAAEQQVAVTEADVLAVRSGVARQVGGETNLKSEALKAGIPLADLNQTISDVALKDALADKLTASVPVSDSDLTAAYQRGIGDYDQVHSAHILVASAAKAKALLALIRKHAGEFPALAAKYSIDRASAAAGGDLGFHGRGALEKPFERAIFAAKPGAFVLAHTRFGYHVIHVLERRTTTLAQARTALRRGLLAQPRADALQRALQEESKKLVVIVDTRIGRWDPAALDVVAATQSASPQATPSG